MEGILQRNQKDGHCGRAGSRKYTVKTSVNCTSLFATTAAEELVYISAKTTISPKSWAAVAHPCGYIWLVNDQK